MMERLSSKDEAQRYRHLASEMLDEESEFDPGWARQRGWKVIPVEDGNHFVPQDVAILVPALITAGFTQCIAIATEDLGEWTSCFRMAISPQDFYEFNTECGQFRYLLMDEERTWAISCKELYILYAAPPRLLEAMIGKALEEARQEYQRYASEISLDPEDPVLRVAKRYVNL